MANRDVRPTVRPTRRDVVRLLGIGAATIGLAACGQPAPTPAKTETKPADAKPADAKPAAPAATSAPAAPAAQPAATAAAKPADVKPAETKPAVAAKAPPLKVTGELRMLYFPFGSGVEQIYADMVKQFEQENPGVKVNLELLPFQDRYPKMLTAVAAGQAWDVMFMTTDALIRFVEAKGLVALDDLLPKEAWDGYDKGVLESTTHQGARWYLPMDRELPVWMGNEAILEKAGWDPKKPPATWADMRELCTKVKALGDPNLTGWGYQVGSATVNDTFYPFLYQAGGRAISADGKEPTFNSEAGVEALEFIVEMFDKGWVSPEYLTYISDINQTPFFQGRQAVSIAHKQNGLTNARKNVPDIKRVILPTLKHKEQWGFGATRSWAITTSSKNREAAAALLVFLTRADNMLKHNESFGYMPPKTDIGSQAFKSDPELAQLAPAQAVTFDEQKHKYGRDMMSVMVPEFQAAVTKAKKPKQALDDAAAKAREMFAKG